MFVYNEEEMYVINTDHIIRFYVDEGDEEYLGKWFVLAEGAHLDYTYTLGTYSTEYIARYALLDFLTRYNAYAMTNPTGVLLFYSEDYYKEKGITEKT